jgi:hypothetical protein
MEESIDEEKNRLNATEYLKAQWKLEALKEIEDFVRRKLRLSILDPIEKGYVMQILFGDEA